MKPTKKPAIIPFPYPIYFYTVVAIALVGLLDAVYLSTSHYRVYVDIGYHSFCAISQAINCDTVSQSPYSILFNVPVPVWGVWGYGLFIFLLYFTRPDLDQPSRMWAILFVAALAFSLYSLILAAISTYLINSYCIMCLLSYAVNLTLLYFSWLVRKRFPSGSLTRAVVLDVRHLAKFPRIFYPGTSLLGLCAISLILFFPAYWNLEPPALSTSIPTGVTAEGYPWIGSEHPEIEIVEFTDYRCFQCKKMHFFLRRIIQENPGKIKLIHRHFPMDHTINPIVHQPFHSGAAKLAMLALIAEEKHKFWGMNDLLFNIDRGSEAVNMRYFARQTNIPLKEIRKGFRDKRLWLKLRKDISDGIQLGLTGTPAYLINGNVYNAQIPPEILKKFI